MLGLSTELAAVVQRADDFIQWISHYPVMQMYTKQRFWQVLNFHTIPHLNYIYASTLYTNYRAIRKFLHTFICRIATYPVDKIIRSLNNWGLVTNGHRKEIRVPSLRALAIRQSELNLFTVARSELLTNQTFLKNFSAIINNHFLHLIRLMSRKINLPKGQSARLKKITQPDPSRQSG